jgi:hypothetical protein
MSAAKIDIWLSDANLFTVFKWNPVGSCSWKEIKKKWLLYIFAGAGSWKQLHETKTQSSSL